MTDPVKRSRSQTGQREKRVTNLHTVDIPTTFAVSKSISRSVDRPVGQYFNEEGGLMGAHHWSPISLVPHLIGSPSHWSPISLVPQLAPMHHSFHWSPISLVPPTHWSPISLVPHLIGPLLIGAPIHKSPTTLFELIGPPSHWSPFSLVHPFSANPNGPPSHWSPISLVPHLIGPPISTHAPPIPMVPHLIGPPSHWSLLTGWSPNS